MFICICVDHRTINDYISWNHSLTGFLTQMECLMRGINKPLNTIQVNLGLYRVNLVHFNALYDGKVKNLKV